jgi:hypothetical protein
VGNGTIDGDRLRVEERGMGGIEAMITGTTVSNAGADGNELNIGGNPCRAGHCSGACRQRPSRRLSTS